MPVCGARTGASQVLTRNRKRKSMRGNAAQSARIERDWQVNRRRAAKHAPGTFASESGTGESSEASKGQRPQVFHATLRGLRLIIIGGYGSARKYVGHGRRRKKLGGGSRAASPSSSDQKSSEGLRWPLERRWTARPPWSRPYSASASRRPPPNPPWPRRCAGSRSA